MTLELPLTAAAVAKLVVASRSASTNSELLASAVAQPADWPHFSALATDDQHGGRGRLGRSWSAPAGTSLALSLLLRPRLPMESYGWLPLLAGVAMVRSIRSVLGPGRGAEVTLKWPNDVLVGDHKICGILCEMFDTGGSPGLVIGSGVNLAMTSEQLPVPWATSLAMLGVTAPSADLVASRYLRQLRGLYDAFAASGGLAERSGLRAIVSAECGTLGRGVLVELPGGRTVSGHAVRLDASGHLVVANEDGEIAVAAGDVTHLRHAVTGGGAGGGAVGGGAVGGGAGCGETTDGRGLHR